jgi:hypothetical protein
MHLSNFIIDFPVVNELFSLHVVKQTKALQEVGVVKQTKALQYVRF